MLEKKKNLYLILVLKITCRKSLLFARGIPDSSGRLSRKISVHLLLFPLEATCTDFRENPTYNEVITFQKARMKILQQR